MEFILNPFKIYGIFISCYFFFFLPSGNKFINRKLQLLFGKTSSIIVKDGIKCET